ncbi:hypothetical protein FB45DRAFT_871640 [Roridomyces roridus]|uniref:Uncharacterized protein n=1 Tax=Roridomyces roridus TaxID=1738132 RepID=A0AAD7FEK9_9AGAR|nr:hypothetical protein FB45DRAFT_871640 [Roridomyces roridus]
MLISTFSFLASTSHPERPLASSLDPLATTLFAMETDYLKLLNNLWGGAGAGRGIPQVPDPRLTGIPDKDDRSKNDRNSGTKDSGEGRKVGGGRWSPTGDTTKTQGDRVPYATSKGSNPDETIKAERRARSSQGRLDQEHEYGESDKVKNSDPGVEVDTPEKPEVEWVKDGMKLKKDKSPNEDQSPVKIDPDLLEPEPELGQDWSGVGENGTGRNTNKHSFDETVWYWYWTWMYTQPPGAGVAKEDTVAVESTGLRCWVSPQLKWCVKVLHRPIYGGAIVAQVTGVALSRSSST